MGEWPSIIGGATRTCACAYRRFGAGTAGRTRGATITCTVWPTQARNVVARFILPRASVELAANFAVDEIQQIFC